MPGIPIVFEIPEATKCVLESPDWRPIEKIPQEEWVIAADKWVGRKRQASAFDQQLWVEFLWTFPTAEGLCEFAERHGNLFAAEDHPRGCPIKEWKRERVKLMEFAGNCYNIQQVLKGDKSLTVSNIRDSNALGSDILDSDILDDLDELYGGHSRVERFNETSELRFTPGDGWYVAAEPGVRSLMWYQIVEFFRLGEEISHCPICGRYWIPTPMDRRAGKLYCSRACNSKAWRKRQKAEAKK